MRGEPAPPRPTVKNARMSVVAAALALAVPITFSASRADGPSGGATNQPATSAAVNGNQSRPDQTLEIPPAESPTPSAQSGDVWSDGTNVYTWQDMTADNAAQADPANPDGALPPPSYAGIDDYMNQEMETEAMGPAFSPFFGAPMPLLMSPYAYGYNYPPYAYLPVSPIVPPRTVTPRPPPFVPPPTERHPGGPHHLDDGQWRMEPAFGMGGLAHGFHH